MQAVGLQLPAGQPQAQPAPTGQFSFGGIMGVQSLKEVLAQDAKAAKERADTANSEPLVQNLVSHIRRHWDLAKYARREPEQQMLRALRSMRGEYDPEKLRVLKDQNSSEIYMMLFATKARQAKALLGDVLLGAEGEKPWLLRPSPVPELPPETQQTILAQAAQLVFEAEQGPMPMTQEEVMQLLRDAKTHAVAQAEIEARAQCARAEKKIDDMLSEGGFYEALDAFLDDLFVFKTAFIKGPVVRKKGVLKWAQGKDGKSVPKVAVENKPCWERTDPLMIYPSPWNRSTQDGYLIERHRMTAQALTELIGVDGYSEDAINQVLDQHAINGLHDWLAIDTERSTAEGRTTTPLEQSSDLIDALQYWGDLPGKLLLEWGMTEQEVPDPNKVYAVEAWLIGNWVIKAAINSDPLARRPYFSDSFKRQPGAFWNLSLYDTMSDCQDMCNAAARALSNNLGIASGPQVWVNVDRLPAGEDITQIFPWKITQTTSDPMGSSAAPMGFFQPTSNASELMAVFEKFSQLADEYTGIPRYMAGIEGANGAGRTASGMSMMIGNAGKTIKSQVSSIDLHVITPIVESAFDFVMRYVGDPDIHGDLNVVACGALALATKDAAQVRRNEFLQIMLNSPVIQQMIGPEGMASLVRSVTSTLDMNSGDIVPSDTEVVMRLKAAALQQQQAAMLGQGQPGQGTPEKPPGQKQLMNGAPVVDNFGAKGS
jgi:hypothetical protein